MIIIRAPFPTFVATTILPNPALGDTQNLRQKLDVHKSMNGRIRTYVNTTQRSSLTYNITINRSKALELEEFIKAYTAERWLLTNHLNQNWLVNLMNNPFQFTSTGTARPGRENVTVQLQLEGYKQ